MESQQQQNNPDDKSTDYLCPIPATHDKYSEAHYFLHRCMDEFHEPDAFRWNLNAFLQALRSVTLMLQSELGNRQNFDNWYSLWQERLKQDEPLKRFVEGRNTVVHKGMLQHKSRVKVGLYKYYQLKIGFGYEIDINLPSSEVLHHTIETEPLVYDLYINKEHSAIGEQIGVHRTWKVDDLGQGDEDVLIFCHRALSRVSQVVSAAHEFAGAKFLQLEESSDVHDLTRVSILLEMDLDPTLPEKWGW